MLFSRKESLFNRAARAFAAGFSALVVSSALLFVQCRQETPQPAAAPDTVLRLADQMPAFNGDLSDWLGRTLQYPESARRADEQGRCVVRFIVTSTGAVRDAKVFRSSGSEALDVEALRVVSRMPAWRPGTDKGKPVSVYFTLPVTFKLDNEEPTAGVYRTESGTFQSPGKADEPITVRFSIP